MIAHIQKTRVLVVDDSVVTRRMISSMIESDPELELCGIAGNGKIALAKIPQLNPDVVTLDIEMPEMDGYEALREIRKVHGRLPVVMFSVLTERSAPATMQALTLGATDYVTKPSTQDGIGRARDELLMKLRALGRAQRAKVTRDSLPPPGARKTLSSAAPAFEERTASSRPARPPSAPADRRVPSLLPDTVTIHVPEQPALKGLGGDLLFPRVDIVAIGSSTGGPNALAELFAKLPAGFPVPIVLTQHMPPLFTRLLAERLSTVSPIKVREAKEGDVLEPGHAYLAPGDHHLTLVRDGAAVKVALNQEPPENSCRPAVDPMLRSVVSIYKGATLAVICTGMGQDGYRGCQEVREHGGQIVVQDEATSVVWGMPGFVAKGGLAHAVLPLADIAREITRRTALKRAARAT